MWFFGKLLVLASVVVGLTSFAAAVFAEETAKTPLNQTMTPVIGGPCEGCDLVFAGLPEDIPAHARLVPEDQPGEALVIEGTVRTQQGEPAEGVIVYAYHTDTNGIYPKAETRHGKLRGWARTDDKGNYRFDTIRPASYPNSAIPQHVHMHIIEPGKCTYYIDDVLFDDDPLLTEEQKKSMLRGLGGEGLVYPDRLEQAEEDHRHIWHVRRDIVLGKNIPGYPGNR